MSITTIADPTVRLVASKKLCTFVATLKANQEMPKNIAEIFSSKTGRVCSKILSGEEADKHGVESVKYTPEEEQFLQGLEVDISTEAEFKELIVNEEDSDDEKSEETKVEKKKPQKKTFLITLKDVKWLEKALKEKRDQKETELYLHELLENCELVLPQNEVLERNPELEARCQKLRQQQEDYEYHKMTRNVDGSLKDAREDTVSFQLKQMNRQLIGVFQFISAVLAGFAFGFIGIELIVGDLDFGFRLLLGVIIALIIALAEIYFLAKRLNEDSIDQDVNIRAMKTPAQGTPQKVVKSSVATKKEHLE